MARCLPEEYIVLDFETGGFLGSPNGRPIETGLLMFKGGRAQMRSVLTDPRKDGHHDFVVEPGALRAHGIDLDTIAKTGIPVGEGLAQIRKLLGDEIAIVGHNEEKFDRPLLERELVRYGLPPIDPDRWYDTAALYKGWKMGEPLLDDETFQQYAKRILSMQRRGLLFSLGFVTCRMPLKLWLVDSRQAKVVDPEAMDDVCGIMTSPDLGFTDKEMDLIMLLGLHRAPFDCAVTHALMQWAIHDTDNFFVD